MKRIPDQKVGLPFPSKDDEFMGSDETFMMHVEEPLKEAVMLKVPLGSTIREWIEEIIRQGVVSPEAAIAVRRLTMESSSRRARTQRGPDIEILGLRLWMDEKFGAYPEFFREGETTQMSILFGNGVSRLSTLLAPEFAEVRQDALDGSESMEVASEDIISKGPLELFDTSKLLYYRDLNGKLHLMDRESFMGWIDANRDRTQVRDFFGRSFTRNELSVLRLRATSIMFPGVIDFTVRRVPNSVGVTETEAQAILKSFVDSNTKDDKLWVAITRGDYDGVRDAIDDGASIFSVRENQNTLQAALARNNPEIAALVYDPSLNTKIGKYSSITVFEEALKTADEKTIRFILSAAPRTKIPIWYAIVGKNTDLTKYALTHLRPEVVKYINEKHDFSWSAAPLLKSFEIIPNSVVDGKFLLRKMMYDYVGNYKFDILEFIVQVLTWPEVSGVINEKVIKKKISGKKTEVTPLRSILSKREKEYEYDTDGTEPDKLSKYLDLALILVRFGARFDEEQEFKKAWTPEIQKKIDILRKLKNEQLKRDSQQ